MRTPEEYIADVTEDVLPPFMSRIPYPAISANDQYHAEMQKLARNVGLNPESTGFRASLLLASDLLDGLAASLQDSEVENKETGAHFIQQASARLRILSLWGADVKSKNMEQIDLR